MMELILLETLVKCLLLLAGLTSGAIYLWRAF